MAVAESSSITVWDCGVQIGDMTLKFVRPKRRAECLVSSNFEWGEFSWLNWKAQLIDADSVTALLPSPTMSSLGYSLSFSIKFQSLCIFASESLNCISLIKFIG